MILTSRSCSYSTGERLLEDIMASFSQRHSWTRQENENILRCYYQSRKPESRGYRARMYELWCNLYPDTPFNEQRIADQALSLLRRKVFTDLELENIHRCCNNGLGNANEEKLAISSVQTEIIHPESDSTFSEIASFHLSDETSTTPTIDLSAHEQALKTKIESIFKADNSRTRLPRLAWNKRLQQILREANKAVSCIETSNLTETSSFLYATAVVVTEALGYDINKPTVPAHNNRLPSWEYRLARKIQRLRVDLSRLVAMEAGNLQQEHLQASSSAWYNIPQKSLKEVLESLKQQVRAFQGRLDRYRKQKVKKYFILL